MFLGEFKHLTDEKGRLAIPSKFRSQLKSGAIVTKGIDRCLFIFGKKEWEILAKKIMALPISQSNPRAFSRSMFGGASEANFDGQGRILIPDYLREYAGLKKSVVVVGLYNRLEIWNEETWKNYKNKTEAASDDIAENLGGLGI